MLVNELGGDWEDKICPALDFRSVHIHRI